ncbi:unnamed protein product [Closterium sp. NIES-54]
MASANCSVAASSLHLSCSTRQSALASLASPAPSAHPAALAVLSSLAASRRTASLPAPALAAPRQHRPSRARRAVRVMASQRLFANAHANSRTFACRFHAPLHIRSPSLHHSSALLPADFRIPPLPAPPLPHGNPPAANVPGSFTLVSTGGTAKAIEEAGLPVTTVDQITNFPEMVSMPNMALPRLSKCGPCQRIKEAALFISQCGNFQGSHDSHPSPPAPPLSSRARCSNHATTPLPTAHSPSPLTIHPISVLPPVRPLSPSHSLRARHVSRLPAGRASEDAAPGGARRHSGSPWSPRAHGRPRCPQHRCAPPPPLPHRLPPFPATLISCTVPCHAMPCQSPFLPPLSLLPPPGAIDVVAVKLYPFVPHIPCGPPYLLLIYPPHQVP